ncbi:MAG TPA: hypothetical protein PLJ58_00865 [bacterium]|nr:hypothetical protein [bacterium]
MTNLKTKIINSNSKVKQSLLSLFLLFLTGLSILSLGYAATPNPGHPWTEVGDGNFIASGPTTARTYTFPDASATVLTTNALVSVAQGGTGTSSLSGVLIGNGTSAVTATTSPAGLLVGTTETQTLTGKTINASDNIIVDTAAAIGGLLKSNGTRLVNFATTTAFSVIRTKTGGDVEWATMSSGPGGADTQIQYNNGGSSWGGDADLTISGNTLHVNKMITLSTSTLPSVATTGTISIFNRLTAGRDMLKFRSDVTDDYSVFQPSIFENYFCLFAPGSSSTANTNHGCIATEVANGPRNTLNAGQVGGYVRKDVFSSTASSLRSSVNIFVRGTQTGQNGFFYFARTHFPDGSYTNSSGVRLVYGMTDQTSAAACGSDNVTNQDMIAFNYSTALSANWRIAADDGSASAPTYTDTGVAFASTTTYDMYIYAPPFPATSTIYWRIDDITNGTTTAEGTATTQLPDASVFMNMQGCNDSVNNVSRIFYIATMYGEVPK